MIGFNRLKTAMLLATLTALVLFVGYALGGQAGLVISLLLATVMNFASYWWSDRIVLRMYGAQQVTEAQAPELFGIVRRLADRAQMPMPTVWLIPEQTPNAFATGRNPQHAAVAVTAGLMQILDRRELAGVIAHELSHIRHRDTLVMTVTASIAGALSMLANLAMWNSLLGSSDDDDEGGGLVGGLIGIIVAPIAAGLIQMAISRSREFMADEAAAKLTGDPLALASALRRLEQIGKRVPMHSGTPATAHLFIVNPFTAAGLAQLFSTHPATEARIERLNALAPESYGDQQIVA